MNILALLLILAQWGFADDRFNILRADFNVPAHCEEMKMEHFADGGIERFFYGRADGLNMGFTFEYPIERGHAGILWEYMKSQVAGTPNLKLFRTIKNSPVMYRDYKIIMANYQGMGVDFHNEGDVLEVLAIYQLRNRFPAPKYFITGGIEYRENGKSRTLGEIDVYVGLAKNCAAILIGEVKLGSGKAVNKAKQQLARFSDFLQRHGAPQIGAEVDPSQLQECTKVVQQ